jgi:heme/copper-type cytochrome/quinol oxidase subunit 2
VGTGPKVALLAAAVVTAVVLLIVLRPGGDDDSSAEQVARAKITVTNGEVSGPERIELEQGQQVVLTVESDVEDEVHVHGYDLLRSVAPGRPAHFDFRAETPGRFEVELHEQELPLAELVVTP